MKQRIWIQKLSANVDGRDFVIGDLHGCIDLLLKLLLDVEFDPDRDRLFSVGDLIDRGQYSLKCLELIDEPWFYAVMGNHEAMMLEFFETYLNTGSQPKVLFDQDNNGFIENGGEWVFQYYRQDEKRMTPEFDHGMKLASSLPLLIIVGDEVSRFHVVHAELLKKESKKGSFNVWLDSNIDQWFTKQVIPDNDPNPFYWGRSIMMDCNPDIDNIENGLSLTFCGHTPDENIRQKLSHVCLDTGAYLSDHKSSFGLTLYEVSTGQSISASYC